MEEKSFLHAGEPVSWSSWSSFCAESNALSLDQGYSSIKDADRIIVLDDGKINGVGTHEELLETNEIYREVYDQQTNDNADFDQEGGDA